MPSNHPRRRFQQILDNVAKIRRHTAGLDQEAFSKNELVLDGVERCLARISEAAVKLDAIAETLAPGPPWRAIRGLGNRLRHDYDAIEVDVLWQIITDDLDPLENACRAAIATFPPE